jgi:uncharacterized membrane-anchored protein
MDEKNSKTTTGSKSTSRGPRPIDRLGARVEGSEAVAEWARKTASGAALLALLCLVAVLVLAWRLRGSVASLAPAVAEPLSDLAGAMV